VKYYSHGDIETNDDFLDFFNNLIPGPTADDVANPEILYPDPQVDLNGQNVSSANSTQCKRTSFALTDYMYACAGQETAVRMSLAAAPVYKLHFAVNNTFLACKGIPHTAETKHTWAEPSGTDGVQYPEVKLLSGYFSDYVALGDPNAGKRASVPQ